MTALAPLGAKPMLKLIGGGITLIALFLFVMWIKGLIEDKEEAEKARDFAKKELIRANDRIDGLALVNDQNVITLADLKEDNHRAATLAARSHRRELAAVAEADDVKRQIREIAHVEITCPVSDSILAALDSLRRHHPDAPGDQSGDQN